MAGLISHTLHVCCEILQLMKAVKTRVQPLHVMVTTGWRVKCLSFALDLCRLLKCVSLQV